MPVRCMVPPLCVRAFSERRYFMEKTKLSGLIRNLLSYNFRTLFLFEVFYKMFAYGLFTPLFLWMTETSISLAGLHYLSAATVIKWLKSPYTWIMIIVALILLSAYVLIDMAAVMICMDCSKRKEYVSGITLLWESIKSVVRLFHWKNALMILYLLAMFPILSVSFLTGYSTSINLPAFIGDEITKILREYWVILLGLCVLLIVIFRYIYAAFYYVLEKKNFTGACMASHYLIYGAYFRDLLRLFLWQIAYYLVYSVTIALLILLVIGVSSLFGWVQFVHAVMISVIEAMIGAVQVLFSCLVIPLSTIYLSWMFYQNKEIIGEPVAQVTYKARIHEPDKRKKRIIMAVSCLVLIVVNLNNIHRLADGGLRSSAELAHETQVTAHRGASAEYPENTLPAFEAAADYGADWIELDVQQTSDGVLIVMHDTNLYRTAGLDKNVWDVTYEEIRELDVGSHKGAEFADVRICTLAEVLETLKGKANLNIELKPTGHEEHFVEQVIDLINEYDMADECMVASMSYRVLTDAKAYDSNIRTIYVMKSAYGYFADLENVDVFSVKHSYITEHIVQSVHLQGKQILAWTVNSKKTMERMINMGVDNLITDKPLTARQKVFEMANSTVINKYIDMLLTLFHQK